MLALLFWFLALFPKALTTSLLVSMLEFLISMHTSREWQLSHTTATWNAGLILHLLLQTQPGFRKVGMWRCLGTASTHCSLILASGTGLHTIDSTHGIFVTSQVDANLSLLCRRYHCPYRASWHKLFIWPLIWSGVKQYNTAESRV